LSTGMEAVPVTVEVPVDGPRPMDLFMYIKHNIVSPQAVVDHEPPSSCKCYGQDCSLDPDNCECIKKNDGECVYKSDGVLQDVDKRGVNEVSIRFSVYFQYILWHVYFTI
jgi:hypothetical protein